MYCFRLLIHPNARKPLPVPPPSKKKKKKKVRYKSQKFISKLLWLIVKSSLYGSYKVWAKMPIQLFSPPSWLNLPMPKNAHPVNYFVLKKWHHNCFLNMYGVKSIWNFSDLPKCDAICENFWDNLTFWVVGII